MTRQYDPIPAAELRAVSDAIRRELSPGGPAPGLVLMDVDPYRLHAYWQLDPASLARARNTFGRSENSHLVLRFREVEESARDGLPGVSTPLEAFDREIEGARGQVEVGLWGRGGTWEAELGLTARDGGWYPLARSQRVRMPPPGPALTSRFTRVDQDSLVQVTLPRPDAAEGPRPLRADLSAAPGARGIPETKPEDGQPVPADPSLRGGGADDLEPRFPLVSLESQASVSPAAPEAGPARHEPMEEQPQRAVEPRIPEVPPTKGQDMLPAAPPAAASSAWSGHSDLELHAELYVYGHARPGYELILFGRRIVLEPDGSFQLRLPLRADQALLGSLVHPDDDPAVGHD